MPAAPAALHQYLEAREGRWLVAYASGVVLQVLCASHYLLFFSVLVGLWILWVARWRDRRALPAIGAASAGALAAFSPVALGYSRIHPCYGLRRTLGEIAGFNADLTALFAASPLLVLWGWTAR
jgi:hypothetical protein